MATMSVSGVASGMDWDSMIDEIITNAAKPAQVQVNKKNNLTNKKSLFEEMKVTMNSLQSSLSPLKLPSTYKAKQVDIERIDTSGSYKGVLTATVNADAEVNVYDLVVNQLARAQTNRSKQITSSNIGSALSSQGLTSGTMYINMMGQKVGIDISSTDSLQTIKSKINNTVKTLDIPVAVTAAVVDNRLIIRSDNTGLGANSMTETLTYNLNNQNTLTAFNVSNSELKSENFVIRNQSGTKLTYGKDYDVVNGNEIRWNQYEETDNVKLGKTVTATYKIAEGDTYESTGTYGKSEAKISGFSVNNNGTLSSRLKIVDDNGKTYTYGKDFTLDSSGKVEWLTSPVTNEPSSYTVSYANTETKTASSGGTRVLSGNDDIDISSITSQYNTLNSTSEIPRVTLTDRDGVLRTYLDLAGDSNFTMKDSDGNTYEYGRDYVIRVNDAGDGYSVTWAISDDKNNDGKKDINDASTVLTTYAQHKGLSTYGMQSAPDAGKTFNFSFSKEVTTTTTGNVKSTDTDKSLSTVLSNVTVPSSAYGTSALTIKNGNTTYTYGTDYTIDSSGNIRWIDTSAYAKLSNFGATYTFGTASSFSSPNISTTSSYVDLTGVPSLDSMGLDTFKYKASNGATYSYITKEYGQAAFTMTDSDGNTYEYGKHYSIRKISSATGSSGFQVVWASNTYWPSDILTEPTTGMPASGLTLQYNNSVSSSGNSSNSKISDVLGVTPSNYNNLTITGTDSKVYTYSSSSADELGDNEFTIVNGNVVVKSVSNHPSSDTGYTLVYDAYTEMKSTNTYLGETTHPALFQVDDGYGNIGGTALSYEQILSDTGLKSTSSDAEFAKYFKLSDNNGDEYVYGTDYRIIRGASKDGDTGEYEPLIEWIPGTDSTNPPNGTGFTLTYTGRADDTIDLNVTRSSTDAVQRGESNLAPLYSYFNGGTSTITSGTKTYYEGIDYEIVKVEIKDKDDDGNPITITNAAVEWKTGTNSEWYYPSPNEAYTINLTTSNGSALTFSGARNSIETLNLNDYGFTSANGSITSVSYTGSSTHTYDLTSTDTDKDGDTPAQNMAEEIGLSVIKNEGTNTFGFHWVTPERTANADLPRVGDEFKAEYTYNANTFTLSDDSDGKLLSALELDQKDSDHYMAAQNAELVLDGETITRDSNDIGEAYDNELIKGMTIHLKGVGEVSMDVSHDAEKAVESIQTFVDTYNDLMTWMNTRMTEKQVDKDTAATIDSDDFRMRWGLLHGNSLLRNTKAKMRSLTSQNFTFSFTQRSSAEEIYGTMGYNGLRNDATLRLRINSKFVDVSILPTDTLQDIIDKINDDSEDGPMHDIYYDDEGKKLTQPLIKATIENDKLVITSTNNDSITMSGTSAMNALKMNYTYKGLFQLGIASTATDYGKSGELEFDTSKFMEALEDNADEVQELMLMFANDFDSWTKSMLNTSASGETSGTLTREIENLDNQINTINEYLEKYQERLDRQEESLRTRYASSETQFAKLSQQANSIAAILNQLNGYANNNNSSSSS